MIADHIVTPFCDDRIRWVAPLAWIRRTLYLIKWTSAWKLTPWMKLCFPSLLPCSQFGYMQKLSWRPKNLVIFQQCYHFRTPDDAPLKALCASFRMVWWPLWHAVFLVGDNPKWWWKELWGHRWFMMTPSVLKVRDEQKWFARCSYPGLPTQALTRVVPT